MAGFKDFVKGARLSGGITGDLMGDLRGDRTLPETFNSLPELRQYLRFHRACDEALRVAPNVWKRYQTWARRTV